MRYVKTVSLVLLAAFYVVAGINHFRVPDFYLSLLPPYIPFHGPVVFWTGVLELTLGVAVLFPKARRWACWSIIAMLVAFLPVHVHMLVSSHLYPEVPVAALWIRFPVQVLFGLWAWWHSRVSAN